MSALYNPAQTQDEYYRKGGIETLDYLHAKLGDDGYEAYLIGKIHTKLHKAFIGPVQTRNALYEGAAVYMQRLLQVRSRRDPTRPDRPGLTDDLLESFKRLQPPSQGMDAAHRPTQAQGQQVVPPQNQGGHPPPAPTYAPPVGEYGARPAQ